MADGLYLLIYLFIYRFIYCFDDVIAALNSNIDSIYTANVM